MCHKVAIRLKMRINDKMRVLVFVFFCGILTVDPTFFHHFQMPNNTFEDVTPRFIRFEPIRVAPQPPLQWTRQLLPIL